MAEWPLVVGAVNMTEQDPAVNVQLIGVNVPVELLLKLTVPAGVEAVPGEVSATVAVHFVCWPTLTELGVQAIVVDVVLNVVVMIVVAAAAALWLVSPT